jgi:CHRD domain/PEP-CTERM motif
MEEFMNRLNIRRLSIGVALGLATMASTAAAQTWSASMNGANEFPANGSAGTGFALLSFDGLTNVLTITGSFSGLTGTTTSAHVHCCLNPVQPENVGVATTTPSFVGFPLGVTGGSFEIFLDLTQASSYRAGFITESGGTTGGAQARLLQGFNDGTAYFNIHSSFAPGGEIRGAVTTVPEPSTVLLMAGGLVAVGVMARRRRGVPSAPRA